nr:extracellular nuclease [uncultured bacterium]
MLSFFLSKLKDQTNPTMKKIILTVCLLFSVSLFSQTGCDELYFSEYGEGSGQNKYIEIYNPTANAVSLTGYTIHIQKNGAASSSGSFTSNATIASGDVYVLSTNQADSLVQAEADTVMAYASTSVVHFNGNDALLLVTSTDTLDVIGVPGVDPGSSWAVGTGSTANHTLVRKNSITEGSIDWTTGATEWDVYAQNTWTYVGSHSSSCITVVVPTGCNELYFSEYGEGSSNHKYIEIYNPTANAVSLTGYTVYQSGNGGLYTNTFTTNATIAAGDVYLISTNQADASILAVADTALSYPSIAHFSGDDAMILFNGTDTVDVIGVPGVDPGSSWAVGNGSTANHTLVRKNSITEGSIDWTTGATEWDVYAQNTWTYVGSHSSSCITVVVPTGCNELYFSEYGEGSSNHKYIEIYNPTANAVSLTGYTVYQSGNGGLYTNTFTTNATIAAGDVYVISTTYADSLILAEADTVLAYPSIVYFNGDDALILYDGTDTVDVIGVPGVDPGSSWIVDTGSTANHTLVRKSSVTGGSTNWTTGATEWDVYAQNTWTYIGSHSSSCITVVVPTGCSSCPVPTYTIANIDGIDSDGVADSLNVYCKLVGTVMGVEMRGSTSATQFTINDGTGGMGVFSSVATAQNYTVTEGDQVRMIGSIGQFNGLTQMYPDSIVFISAGNTLPTAVVVTALGESTESELVTFEHAILVDPSQWSGSGSGFNVDATNGTDTISVRIDQDVDLYSQPAPIGAFNVLGIGGQYDSSSPYSSGYQLLPRYNADIRTDSSNFPKLVVSEIMSGSNASAWFADWFEIRNYGDTLVDLTGFSWDDASGISGTSVFPAISIAAGEAIVVWNDVAANEDSLLISWNLNIGSVQVISKDELNGSFQSLSQNGDGVYLFNASGTGISNSLYLTSNAGYTVEFDTSGIAIGVAVPGVNGAYISSLGDIGSPGVNERLSPIFSNGMMGSFCAGDTLQLSFLSSYSQSYLWNTGDTTNVIDVYQAGNYSVVITSAGGSIDTISIVTTELTADVTITSSGSLNLCDGQSVSLSVAAGIGQSYLWNTGQNWTSISSSQASSYYAIVTTSDGCIDTTAIYTTTLLPDPDTTVTSSGPLDFCSNGSVTLSAVAGQTYLWSNGDTSQSTTTTQAGSYYAIITNTDGCIGTTATNITTVFADPDTSVTTSGSLNLCSGESITLTAASGQNYLWNTGATAQSITTGLAGSYFARVTTSNGCIDTTATYVVTINPVPNPIILAPQLELCSGQTVTLSTQTTYSSYLWGGDSTGTQDTLTVSPGTYWLSVTNSSGCANTDTITITELAPYTTQPEVCILTNDPVTGYNQIIWERSSKKGVEYYNVYRDGVIGYTKVGSKGVNQLSQLTDNTANPGLQPYKYYLTITDSCGNEHGSSISEHSTIHLQSSIGTSGEVNLLWTSYVGRTPLYYRISRKAASASVYTVIDSVNLTNNTYTDFNTLTGFTKYQISAVMGSGCNSSSKTGVTSSLSNASTQNTVSISEDAIGSIVISPNPNTGYFSITVDQQQVGSVYRIIDNLGRLIDKGIITEQTQAFDLSDKPKGIYRIQVSNENMAKTLSVVIQ